jgi:hypothetical protein
MMTVVGATEIGDADTEGDTMSMFERPETGEDSVPMPEGPHNPVKWRQYLAACERAAFVETVEQAEARCRTEAEFWGLTRHYRRTAASVLRLYDKHFEQAVEKPEYLDLDLDECGPVSEFRLDDLTTHWSRMQAAFEVMDRDAYAKAAHDFATTLAFVAMGAGLVRPDVPRD